MVESLGKAVIIENVAMMKHLVTNGVSILKVNMEITENFMLSRNGLSYNIILLVKNTVAFQLIFSKLYQQYLYGLQRVNRQY